MIPRELIRKIRRIEIRTNRMVNDVLAGEYHSVFKGRGVEFEEVREYMHGDDIRTIDWNVTARMGNPFVKRYREERELTVMLAVDASSSSLFGTADKMKGELAVELSAVLAFSAIKNNDRVGLVLFTDRVEKFIPPKKGKKHVLRLIRELLMFEPAGGSTDIKTAMDFLGKILTRKTVVFLLSDFLSAGYEEALRMMNNRHDLVTISITDPREIEMPPIGFLELQDAETGEIVIVDTYDASIRQRLANTAATDLDQLTKSFKRMQVDHIPVRTDKPYIDPLVRFFQQRAKRY
ncbi:MAG TPA: DUF58 domain-containing protein [bacterium]|nr:DUF58 domain-containing protein [Candidatus Omnitrophota bacterium]HOJ62242.1 DUF58 domain-containing protein [bacterium]HOL95711.1 DUF58 domain-containing protein [bacterium]HPO99145.1 DUF58 domain-containing protein [bacterium]